MFENFELDDLLILIRHKEKFVILLSLSIPSTIFAGGFYASVYPFLSTGIFGILGLASLTGVVIFSFLVMKKLSGGYYSRFDFMALLFPIILLLLLVAAVFYFGGFVGS